MKVAVVAVAAAVGLGACGGGEEPPSSTAFARALDTIGEAVLPGGTGFGWVDVEAVGAGGPSREGDWAASALGPGADEVLERRAEIEAETGLDLSTASQALALSGSYSFGVRFDGVAPDGLERSYRRAGAAPTALEGWTALDLGDQPRIALGTRLEVLGSLGTRTALRDDAVILARFEGARRALAGGGSSPLSDAGVALAASCLGDVIAARTQLATHTYNRPAAPDLLAVGVRAPSGPGREEVICALDDSESAVSGYADALERTLVPGGRDALTGERFDALVADAEVDTLADGDLHAARAELTLSADREPGLLLGALNRGSVLTYVGAPEPGFSDD